MFKKKTIDIIWYYKYKCNLFPNQVEWADILNNTFHWKNKRQIINLIMGIFPNVSESCMNG